jgi:hypothetical protein
MDFKGGVAGVFEFGYLGGTDRRGLFGWWWWYFSRKEIEVAVSEVDGLKIEVTFRTYGEGMVNAD